MLRISALIAVLALTTATAASAAQAQSKSVTTACYNSQTCAMDCNKQGIRMCELYCKRLASTRSPCK